MSKASKCYSYLLFKSWTAWGLPAYFLKDQNPRPKCTDYSVLASSSVYWSFLWVVGLFICWPSWWWNILLSWVPVFLSDPIILGAKATRTHEAQGWWVLGLRSRLAVSYSELGGETFRWTYVSSSPTQPSMSMAPGKIEETHMTGSIFAICCF